MTDLLITGATVLDGTGAAAVRADVAVEAGRIVAIGASLPRDAVRTIDADGLVLAPGFIDMHAHSDLQILANPDHTAKVSQGITLEVVGQDGLSFAPVDEPTRAALRRQLAGWNGEPDDFEFDFDTVAQPMRRATFAHNQEPACFVVFVVLSSKRGDRHKTVGAIVVQLYEKSGFGHAADAGAEARPDPVGEPGRDEPVGCVTLRCHGAPLGCGNLRADPQEQRLFAALKSARSKPERRHKRAMHEQIGIAADGRGEMCIAAQVQPEVTDVFDGVLGLCLTAQNDLVDQQRVRRAHHVLENAVELSRPESACLRQTHVERAKEVA